MKPFTIKRLLLEVIWGIYSNLQEFLPFINRGVKYKARALIFPAILIAISLYRICRAVIIRFAGLLLISCRRHIEQFFKSEVFGHFSGVLQDLFVQLPAVGHDAAAGVEKGVD